MATYEEDLALPPELLAEQDAIKRRMAIAQALMQQAQDPLVAPQGGRYVVPISPLQGIAKLAKTYLGAKGMKDSQEAAREVEGRGLSNRRAEMERILQAGAGTPEIQQPSDQFGGGPGRAGTPGGRDKLIQAMAQSQYPEFQQVALQQQMRPPIQLGRTLVDSNTYKPLAVDQAVAAEQEAARKQRMAELEMKLVDARSSREEKFAAQKELANMQSQSRKELANMQLEGRKDMAKVTEAITKQGRGESKYAEERMKAKAGEMTALEKSAGAAYKQIQALDRFLEASKTGTEGGAQPILTDVRNFLSTFGVPSGNLKEVRQMEQAVNDILATKFQEFGARGLTDRDMAILQASLPRVETDRRSRENIANILRKAHINTINDYQAQIEEEARLHPDLAGKLSSPPWVNEFRKRGTPEEQAAPSGSPGSPGVIPESVKRFLSR